jgi:three-Cys-motif partner protein
MPERGTNYEALLARIQMEPDGLPARRAGPWSRDKLALLAYYLPAFSRACIQAGGWYYIDGFAGNGANEVEDFARSKGTAMLGAGTVPSPTRAILVERNPADAAILRKRLADSPFAVSVHEGDCNKVLPALLRSLPDRRRPGLCVLDPEGLELDWATIASCREHRRGPWPFELLIYFSTPGAARTAAVTHERLTAANQERLDRLYGNQDWRAIAEDQRESRLPPGEAGRRYLNLYLTQLENLGYETRARPAIGTRGGLMYHIVFASANPTGLRIMDDGLAVAYGANRPLRLL